MKKSVVIVAILIIGALLFAPALAEVTTGSEDKPIRIAVLPLKNGSGVQYFWKGDFNPGQAMTDLIVNRLLESDRYLVFERQHLDDILEEQNLGTEGRITPETAVEVGRLAEVEYLLTGTVTEFTPVGRNDGGAIAVPLPFGAAVKVGSKRVRTAVEVRLIDVKSGLISAGISQKDETSVSNFGFGAYYKGFGAGYYNEEFTNSALGKSMTKVANKVVEEMDEVKFKEIETFKPLTALVIHVDGKHVFLNKGEEDGVISGMVFRIFRPIEVEDLESDKKITLKKPIGEIKIISVEATTSVGEIQDEEMEVKPGDKAKRVK